MEWRVNDAEVLLAQDDILIDHSLLDSAEIVNIHLTTDDLDEVVVGLELHLVDGHLVHLIDDALVVWRENLSAVVPVSLVAIVLLRVVRSGDVDTCLSMELADSKRDFGSWAE